MKKTFLFLLVFPVFGFSQLRNVGGGTGTGNPVYHTSPILVTPALGTPSSAILTNATGYTGANLTLTDITTNDVSNSKHGFFPKLISNTVYYIDNSGVLISLSLGASGTFLKSNGATSAPTFSTPSGSGDVVGPIVSVAGQMALFDGITGKLIKADASTGIVKTTAGVTSVAVANDFPTLNQNTTGSAGSLKSVATTGLMTVTGIGAASTRAKTVRDADDTFLELGGSYTPTGTWTNLAMVTPTGILKGDVGLGNVTNESKATMFTNAVFTGTFTAPNSTITNAMLAGSIDLTTKVTGILPAGNLPATVVYTGQANTYTAGMKQTFSGDATNAGIRFSGLSADPSSLSAGDVFYRSDLEKLSYRGASATKLIVEETLTQTLTNKNLTSGTNTFPTFNQNTTGSAATLLTGRTISISGDITYTSPSFDGSANVTAAGTLATVASAGTTGSSTAIPVITINAKGLTTTITTAAVIAPAGTLSGGTLASGVTASSLTSFGSSPSFTTPNINAATGASLVLSSFLNEAKGADIASATTTDIGAATGNYVDVTGTVTITGLGTVQAGTQRIVTFTGALILTHNATSLILPGAVNRTTVAGDVAHFVSLGSGNWKCVSYQPTTVTGTGGRVLQNTPTLITPNIGVATATSLNGHTFTAGSSTFTGTAAAVYTFPTATKTISANDGSNWTISGQAIGDIPVASSTTAYGKLAAVAAGSYLRSAGVGAAIVWSTLTLPNAATTGDILTATNTNVIGVVAAVATGSVLISQGTGTAPVYQNTRENWTTFAVSGSDITTTGQTMVNVTGLLSGTLTNSTSYEVEAMLYVGTSAVATGTQYAITGGGSGTAATVFALQTGTTTTNAGSTFTQSVTAVGGGTFLTTASAFGIIWIKGIIVTRGSGTADIAIQHLKVTSGTSTVKIGSWMKIRLLN